MPSMGGRLGQALSRLGYIRLGAGPAGAAGATKVTRLTDKTLPYIGHLYDNKGTFKRLLDPFLNRPVLKQTLNGGFQPITLDMPLPVRPYADIVVGDAPASFYRCGDASGSLTDLMNAGPALAATVLDKSAGMSFGNPGALTNDATTALANSGTTGYLFSGNSLFDGSGPTAWSVEFMFYATAVSTSANPLFRHQGIADGSGNPGDVLMIYLDAAGQIQFFIHPPNSGIAFTSTTGYTPSLNAWHLLELVNVNGSYSLYIDGVLRYSSGATTYNPQLGQGFEICTSPARMQELAIYGFSMTAAQVTAHQGARATGAYQATITADLPLGYWRLGEQVLSTIAEPAVGNIRMMVKSPAYSQVPLVNDDKGIQVSSIGGTGSSYFASATARPITGTKFALEAWIKPGALKKDIFTLGGAYLGGRCIVKCGDITIQSGFMMTHNGPDILVGAPSNPITFANALSAGKHHLMWVHDSSASPTTTLYVDGVKVGTNNPVGIAAPAAGVAIGADPALTASFEGGFGGEIDEVGFWNFAPTAAQAQAHYKAGVDLTQGDLLTLTEQGGDGTVLYKGIVEDIPDDYDLAPSFQIGVQPMVVQLADAFFSHNYNVPTDIAQMVQDAVNATGNLLYTGQSIPMTGILAQVDFTNSTSLAVLEHAKKIGGPYYWWFVDQLGVVWFQQFDLTRPATWSTKMGVDHNARRFRSPIGNLKNKVLCIGNIPPNGLTPIISLYTDLASQSQYGVRILQPPLTYPNIVDQPTLDKVTATVGAELNRRVTKVELLLPAFGYLIQLGVNTGATMRYWEPNKNPLLEAEYGSGRYSPNYVILDVEQDGPHQKVVLAEVPITSDDLKYEGDRQQQRDFLQQLLHPDLSSTVPMSMSGGFFSAAVGTPITLPAGFTGFSLDAQNGLSLYNAGVLIGRFGSGGASGVLQAFGGYQPVDSTHRAILRYEYTPDVQTFSKVFLSFSLKAFRATTQGVSGASSASSSSSTGHTHGVPILDTGGGVAGSAMFANVGANRMEANLGIGGATFSPLSLNESPNHSHTIAHTHTITAPDGLFDTGMAQGVHVFIDGTDRTTALGGPWGSGSALDVSDLDVSAWITTTGWHEVQLSSTSLGVIIAQVSSKVYTKTI